MIDTHTIRQGAIVIVGIFLILFVLVVSITRQTLYAPTAKELQARAGTSFSTRIQELRDWPPHPDHPLYLLRMVRDRLRLVFTPQESLVFLQLELASARRTSAAVMLARHRSSLALTTLTKSNKYLAAASMAAAKLSPQSSSAVRGAVAKEIRIQIQELERMKTSFSDEQKSVVDRLLSELTLLAELFRLQ